MDRLTDNLVAVNDKARVANAPAVIYSGLVGRVVAVFEPHTEADPLGIAAQFLVAFGSAVGSGPHVHVGETTHYCNEFLALVGASAHGRKGDGLRVALRAIADADPGWRSDRVLAGLSTGEGLINAVRNSGPSSESEWDPGVDDKRVLVTEAEFAKVLIQATRLNNILSATLREAWDHQDLGVLTRKDALRATAPHVSVIAHSTTADLLAHLTKTDAANGFGNRFIFLAVGRAKLLSSPGRADSAALSVLVADVQRSLEFAQACGEMTRSDDATALWDAVYPELTRDFPGIIGQLLARAEAHVLRLSMLYALCAQSKRIEEHHLRCALALWEQAEQSVLEIFGATTGNILADTLLAWLPEDGTALTTTTVRTEIFSNHITAKELSTAIADLKAIGAVTVETVKTRGRPVQYISRTSSDNSSGSLRPVQWCAESAESAITSLPCQHQSPVDGELGGGARTSLARASGAPQNNYAEPPSLASFAASAEGES